MTCKEIFVNIRCLEYRGHGDLIDVSAVDTRYSDPEVIETLNAAPTIIKADKLESENEYEK